ncbi:hypothetical protein QFC21_005503 [Naganishia friedmannii]|uniref:Uncharacterized protein n=1 Tax=Naganishia friedmannii TaxID=89922 RepID=A0ACC2V988_9TREE|nr:hypothetical protein QFC21_005503 [Naganishia friedmannii]
MGHTTPHLMEFTARHLSETPPAKKKVSVAHNYYMAGKNVRITLTPSSLTDRVNTPEYTDLDARLAAGGPDQGFPVDYIVNKAVSANGGDEVKIHWLNWPEKHIGPLFNMMASCGETCSGRKGAELDWFKISQQNYDPVTKTWPLEIPLTTTGLTTKFTLPTNLPSGQYLLSQTLIAMHSQDGPQYHVSAFEIDFKGTGATLPKRTMTIPAMYTEHRNDVTQFRFMVDNPLCYDFGLFRVPGVPVYDGSDSSAGGRGNGAEEFVDQPLSVPSTCSWKSETVVGSILGASAGTSGGSSSSTNSNAPVGSLIAGPVKPSNAPPTAPKPSQAPPAAPPSGQPASGTSDKDCLSILTGCYKSAAAITDYTTSMSAHTRCDDDYSTCQARAPAKRLTKKHHRNRSHIATVW